MNIALIGYGKMGQAIEAIALQHGHTIVLKITAANAAEMTTANLKKADVAIEFTNPHSAKENVLKCLNAGVPTVSGTTGWNNELHEAQHKAQENNTAFLHASNFSVGVNLFFEVNKQLAQLMNEQEDYNVFIEEIHHTQKKDSPSGTAITLAEQILARLHRKKNWQETSAVNTDEILSIQAFREENIPGTHVITYTSAIDDITIKHTAHNRSGFAKGAVLAAEYIFGKIGNFTMNDVLGIK
jgi:4-hydroxy-tetrahydrodipicolinate reductase